MTQTIGFTKDEYGDYVATTGERIAKYRGAELYGRGSSGWYITEVSGEFFGIKFDTLTDAKRHLIRKLNTMQYVEIVIAESAAVLAKYAQTQKVGA
jgi:hypothetical protein